jgi:hypothetical protein
VAWSPKLSLVLGRILMTKCKNSQQCPQVGTIVPAGQEELRDRGTFLVCIFLCWWEVPSLRERPVCARVWKGQWGLAISWSRPELRGAGLGQAAISRASGAYPAVGPYAWGAAFHNRCFSRRESTCCLHGRGEISSSSKHAHSPFLSLEVLPEACSAELTRVQSQV